jgi:hypothetical protein
MTRISVLAGPGVDAAAIGPLAALSRTRHCPRVTPFPPRPTGGPCVRPATMPPGTRAC